MRPFTHLHNFRSRLLVIVTSLAFVHLIFLPAYSSLAEAAEQRIRYFHPDHLGSTNLVTDETGNIIERTTYKPFGEVHQREIRNPVTGQLIVADEASRISPYGYTGQRQDVSTGLYFYGGRYYDPQLGRFISPDPLIQNPYDPQMLNRYAYVRNNPVNNVDPSGYSFLKKLFQVAAVALATFAVIATLGAAMPAFALAAGLSEAFVSSAWSVAVLSATSSAAFATGAQQMSNSSSMSNLSSQLNAGAQGLGAALGNIGQSISGFGQQAFRTLAPAIPETGLFPWPLALGGAGLAAILQTQGAGALRQALDSAFTQYPDEAPIVEGYHATSFQGSYKIATEGFALGLSNPSNRFGKGVYLASSREAAIAERARHGLTTDVVVKIKFKLTKNFPAAGPLARRPISRLIGAAVRAAGGSITYGSFAEPGVINYVLFNPAEQQVGPVQIDSYGQSP